MKRLLPIFLVLGLYACQPAETPPPPYDGAVVAVDFSGQGHELHHFWKSTGYSPGRMNLHPDMQQTLQYTAKTASNGVVYVRPHYLLDLTAAWGFEEGNPQYHWAPLDSALDVLHDLGYSLIFEFMGKPYTDPSLIRTGYDFGDEEGQLPDDVRTYFTDFAQPEQIKHWHTFATAVVQHLRERYGDEWLKTWYFETVNEPDITKHFWPYGDDALLDYFDACHAAVKAANPDYLMGGPGTARHLSDTFKRYMAHADTGRSVITGEPLDLDYFSVHLKRLPDSMVARQLEVIEYVRKNHPRFGNKPFMNDEADPAAGWRRHWWWRAHPWYASFVVRSAHRSYEDMVLPHDVNYVIQSNDNGFQGSFAHRTQLGRFRSADNPGQFYLIKQQVLEIMSHLARFGHTHFDDSVAADLPYVGSFATQHEQGYALALYNSPHILVKKTELDTYTPTDSLSQVLQKADTTVQLQLTGLEPGDYWMVHYALDSTSGAMAPYREMGFPDSLTTEQVATLRLAQEATLASEVEKVEITGSFYKEFYLHGGAVHVLQLVKDGAAVPAPEPVGQQLYTGFNGEAERLLFWDTPENFAVKTYEIEGKLAGGEWQRLNKVDVIDGAFMHSPVDASASYSYRIRAVGYHGATTPWRDFL